MDILREGARALGIELSDEQAGKLLAHLDLLDEWNQRMNLTAIRDRGQQLTKHLLDSLSVRPHLRGSRIADVGSGAGFPGIPLAIVSPGLHFALIESTGKKCRFLERFDTVLARAVGPVADLVRNAGPLVAGGGRLLAMKGRFPEDELAKKLNGWKVAEVHRLVVPGLDEERHVVELCRSHDKTD
jgi:16S rRNA (guanine527-N7)-methyltransferase